MFIGLTHEYVFLFFFFPLKSCDASHSNNLAMFKAVLKKNRDGAKGSKKDSGMLKVWGKNKI